MQAGTTILFLAIGLGGSAQPAVQKVAGNLPPASRLAPFGQSEFRAGFFLTVTFCRQTHLKN
jgi:hypothetical protein